MRDEVAMPGKAGVFLSMLQRRKQLHLIAAMICGR